MLYRQFCIRLCAILLLINVFAHRNKYKECAVNQRHKKLYRLICVSCITITVGGGRG